MLYLVCTVGCIIHLIILNVMYFAGIELPTWIGITYLPWFIMAGVGLLISYIEKRRAEKALADLILQKAQGKTPIKLEELERRCSDK